MVNGMIKNSADFLKSLKAHLSRHSEMSGKSLNYLLSRVAFERFLARVMLDPSPSFLLKGGYGMELRYDRARATTDIDLTYLKKSKKQTSFEETTLEELQHLCRTDLQDHFTYQIGFPKKSILNAPYGGASFPITARIGGESLRLQFSLDIGGDFLVDDVDIVKGTDWLLPYGISAPLIRMISIPQQFAEKIHAYTFPRNTINSRTKDLIDLFLLIDKPTEKFYKTLQRVFSARNTHLLPAALPLPPPFWEKPFAEKAQECGIPLSLEESFFQVSIFYDQILKFQ